MVTGNPKSGTHYNVIVSSWRPDQTEEIFDVDSGVFNRTVVGKTVRVELHHGFFGVPWSDNIVPD
jgi:hypothetical protein